MEIILTVPTMQAIHTEDLSNSFLLEQNKLSHLFSIDVAFGEPAQATKMLLDLSSNLPYAFSTSCTTYLTRPHKFYTKSQSTTATYLETNSVYSTETSGF